MSTIRRLVIPLTSLFAVVVLVLLLDTVPVAGGGTLGTTCIRTDFILNAALKPALTVGGSTAVSGIISTDSSWTLPNSTYPLSPVNTVITDVLSSIKGEYYLAYVYDAWDAADPWKKYNTAAPPFLNDLTEMGPGWGYWIRVSEDCVWSVP